MTQRVELTRKDRPYTPPYVTQSAVGTSPPNPPATGETVTFTLDGQERTAAKGTLIITAADEAGVYIPRFCYHPRMKPVGMCRMCLVEVTGPRGATLMPACYNPVADGMVISTTSEMTKKAQDGVLEFLLVNHPLDCPVCDKGGECPLQDQTLAYGPGESRFVEEKRHWDKPIPLSTLVYLDRERCIQCGRCVRFADEVAGDPLIDFAERGDTTEVATFPTEPYADYFSGNVVQICPVGALTAKPYRFRARPWDLEQVESTCTSCSVGCRVAAQASSDELTRYIGVDADPVNWGWLCDKGRFDFQAVNSPERLRAPMIRQGDELVEVSWPEALAAAADGLAAAARIGDGDQVAVIGGSRLPNEDAYAWAKLARLALRTDHVDAQLGDGLPAETVLGLPKATIDQAAAAPVVITLCGDIKEELPVLYLRLRDAAQKGQAIIELSPSNTGMTRYSAASLRYRPGQAAALVRSVLAGEVPEVSALLDAAAGKAAGGPAVVVVLGRPSLAETGESVAEAARALAGLEGVAFLSGLRRSNVHGALDMGLAPGVLPGRVGLDQGREWYSQHWGGELPAAKGLDTAGILEAATHGRIGGLVLLGADPLTDFPDGGAALRGIAQARFVVAVDTFLTDSVRKADVVLPAATYAERRGTFTNLEGRVSRLGQIVTSPGSAWPDWMIAVELAARMGHDFGWSSLEDIWAEIEAVSPLHAGVSYDLLSSREGRDGVPVPLGAGGALRIARRLDPMADPGIQSTEAHLISPTEFFGAGAGRLSAFSDAPAEAATGPGGDEAEPASAANAPTPETPAESASESGPDTAPPAESPDGPRPAMLAAPAAGPATASSSAPADTGELLLVSGRTLWDGGTALAHSPSLAGLHPAPTARIHPDDVARLELTAGAAVRVSTARGSLDLPVTVDPSLAPGTVAVTFNLPGASAASLIDSRSECTAVTLSVVPARSVDSVGGSGE